MLTGHKMGMTHAAGQPFYNEVYNYTQDDKNIFLPLWDKTIGRCLQLIGTEVFRVNFDADTWVKALFSTTGAKCLERGHILVMPDVRFPNEADAIIDRGGLMFRLEGDPLDIRKNSTRDLNHLSETSLDDYKRFSAIIDNNVPDLDVFRSKVKQIMFDYNI